MKNKTLEVNMSARKRGKFWAAYRGQGGRCYLCGIEVAPEEITRDHVTARARGGSPGWDNIKLACEFCNNEKSKRERK